MNLPFRAQLEVDPDNAHQTLALNRIAGPIGESPWAIGSSRIFSGTGNPNSTVVGSIGDLYLRTDLHPFRTGTTFPNNGSLYVKILGNETRDNWVLALTGLDTGFPNTRVPFGDGSSVLQSSANLTFDGTTLNALQIATNQITFPATQAPSSNANALDDYEEGTWTPTFGGTGGQTGQVYAAQVGTYIKIGQLVLVRGRVALSTLGTITGQAVIKGLPFTTEAAGTYGGISIGYYTGLTTAVVALYALAGVSQTFLEFYFAAAAATALTAPVQADLSNTSDIRFGGCYRTTA